MDGTPQSGEHEGISPQPCGHIQNRGVYMGLQPHSLADHLALAAAKTAAMVGRAPQEVHKHRSGDLSTGVIERQRRIVVHQRKRRRLQRFGPGVHQKRHPKLTGGSSRFGLTCRCQANNHQGRFLGRFNHGGTRQTQRRGGVTRILARPSNSPITA